MAIVLGDNQYGKAETRLVRVVRGRPRHELRDLNVTTTLAGELAATHLTGDNAGVLPTDSQKNTVYAFAKRHGVGEIEEFGLLLARHFVTAQPTVHRARVSIEDYAWRRLGDHSFERSGAHVRTATVTCSGDEAWVVSGLAGLVLLNSTDSEFHGFARDPYTTLPETKDRILATEVNVRWRHATADGDWASSFAGVRQALVDAFVETYSFSLQQTLYSMGRAVLARAPEVVEVRLSLPNRHHLLVDLAPFGLENPNEVFVAADRPYGLIEGTVLRDDAPPPGLAWW
ncbi:MAG TPA: urate oxidase [Micromonosporaceae bacterium]|nr:urate oxidase [Micromonosporaceae bacterium]